MEIRKHPTNFDASLAATDDIPDEVHGTFLDTRTSASPSSSTAGAVIPTALVNAVLSIATAVWRIRSRVEDSTGETKEDISKDDLKKMKRYLDTIFHSLSGVGIEIRDRTGEAFDYGLPEKVVTAQSQSGISKEQILETLRPTIYWSNQIVQQGEVVIATPKD
jgi:hypothetical protein